jgi:hypothetical protein
MRRGYTHIVHHADGTREITEVRSLEGSIVLDPDVQVYFPDAEAVNTALRGLIALRPQCRRPTRICMATMAAEPVFVDTNMLVYAHIAEAPWH